MDADIDLDRLPAPARRVLGPDAPPPARMMAARGVMPGLKPGEIVTVVAALTRSEDAAVQETARATLGKLPPPVLTGALGTDLDPPVVHLLAAAYRDRAEVVEKLVVMPRIAGDTLELLAQAADERIGEIIATNEQKMLAFPRVIEQLYLNKRVRMSTADRLIELAVRNRIELGFSGFREAAEAIQNELIPEPTEEPTFDDVLFQETDRIAAATAAEDEDTHEPDEEGQEQLKEKFLPLYAQIAQMNVTQKIRRALLGASAERMLLVRDTNRLVAEAAVKSPLLHEHDAARIAASRAVLPDVLRVIAMNKEFTRSYRVKFNLVTNPRTPQTFSLRLVQHLRDADLRQLAKSRDVPSVIQTAVRQHLFRKQSGKS
jgi:hypothetical protein